MLREEVEGGGREGWREKKEQREREKGKKRDREMNEQEGRERSSSCCFKPCMSAAAWLG